MSETSLADQKKLLEGQVAALGTELLQLTTGHRESLIGMLISHFVSHRGSQIESALADAKGALAKVNDALAQVPAPAPAAPSTPAIPGITA